MSHIVTVGNPTQGFKNIGPFKHPAFACEWADTWLDTTDWWVTELDSPSTFEKGKENERIENK
jgi:hypothetical protein